MADSNITKRALGESLKSLMREDQFSKISVGEICDRCSMNRKSFYYHFRDKYELVNWIFEREFVFVDRAKDNSSEWDGFERLCCYFYENKEFYKQAFKIEGQNSFEEYFAEYCKNTFSKQLKEDSKGTDAQFQSTLLAGMVVSAFKFWLLKNDDMTADRFFVSFKSTLEGVSVKLYPDVNRFGWR